MKRLVLSGVLGVFMLGSVFAAAPAVKFTFTGVDLLDSSGNVVVEDGTIRAGVKTTRRSQVINCNYYTATDQYAGEFEADNAGINGDSASAVKTFCEQSFQNRQILPK